MKDKAEVLIEVERLRSVQAELTSEIASLHTDLEKERSKNTDPRANKDKVSSFHSFMTDAICTLFLPNSLFTYTAPVPLSTRSEFQLEAINDLTRAKCRHAYVTNEGISASVPTAK